MLSWRLAERRSCMSWVHCGDGRGNGPEKAASALSKKRYFDVGIAEQHGGDLRSGHGWTAGLKPVAAIYSTFMQRAFDQVFHDVCMQDLHVVFAMDRCRYCTCGARMVRRNMASSISPQCVSCPT